MQMFCPVKFTLTWRLFGGENNLVISILIITHGCFTFSELTLGRAKRYIQCHCSLGAEIGPNKAFWRVCVRAP